MIAFVIALGLLVASVTVLPAVVGEITFSAISLLTGGMVVYLANHSQRSEFRRGIMGLAGCAFVIGVANAFWVYGGLMPEFPEWANFWGEFAIGISYAILFYALSHAFWNLTDTSNSVLLGFLMFAGMFAVGSLLFLTLFSGLTEGFEAGIDFTTASYIWFSGALFVFSCLNAFLSSGYRAVSSLLAAGFLGFFVADIIDLRFDFLPESLVSLFWNTGVVLMYAAFVTAAHYYAFGKAPSLVLAQRSSVKVASQGNS
jgi:hypothetical protein